MCQAKKKAEIERTELETLKCITETPLFTPAQIPSIEATLASVTTGQPTVPIASSSGESKTSLATSSIVSTHQTSSSPNDVSTSKLPGRSKRPQKNKTLQTKVPVKKAGKGKRHSKRSLKKKCNGNPSEDGAAHTVIAYSDVSETVAGASQEADLITVGSSRARISQGPVGNMSKVDSCGLQNGTEKNEGNNEKGNQSSDEDDIDIEIDIENDDEENSVLQSRSTSPSSVYKLLLRSADIDSSVKKRSKTDIDNTAFSASSQVKVNKVKQEDSYVTDQNISIDKNESKFKEGDGQTSFHIRSLSPVEKSQISQEEEDEDEEEDHHVKTETIGEIGRDKPRN